MSNPRGQRRMSSFGRRSSISEPRSSQGVSELVPNPRPSAYPTPKAIHGGNHSNDSKLIAKSPVQLKAANSSGNVPPNQASPAAARRPSLSRKPSMSRRASINTGNSPMVSPEKSFAAQMSEPPLQAHSTPKTNGNPHRKSLGDGGHRHNDGGVTVAVRLRPLFGAEREGGATEVFMKESPTCLVEQTPKGGLVKWQFMHHLFGPDDSTPEVFDTLVAPLLNEVLAGYNASVFAYGQTASGKTHTIFGDHAASQGILAHAMNHIFAAASSPNHASGNGDALTVSISVVQIYNEQISDLLWEPPPGTKRNAMAPPLLSVGEDKQRGVFVKGAKHVVVPTPAAGMVLLDDAEAMRTAAATEMNHSSSRSHCVVRITVQRRFHTVLLSRRGSVAASPESALKAAAASSPQDDENGGSGGGGRFRTSIVNFIDLAGSERAKRTGATGAILKEASQINRSLMQLGLVVSRLAFLSEGNQNASSSSASSPSTGGSSGGGHIPYRNSKLTHLLADSLGGRALAVMVTCVSPSSFDQEETVNSLKFASRASVVKHAGVQLNAMEGSDVFGGGGFEVFRAELEALREALASAQASERAKSEALEVALMESDQATREAEAAAAQVQELKVQKDEEVRRATAAAIAESSRPSSSLFANKSPNAQQEELAEELAMTRDALSKLLDAHNGGRIEDILAALKRGGGGGGDGDGNDANRIDKKKQDSRGTFRKGVHAVMAANRFVKAGAVRSPAFVENLGGVSTPRHPSSPKAKYGANVMESANEVAVDTGAKPLWVGTPVGSDPSGLVAHLKLANATLELEVARLRREAAADRQRLEARLRTVLQSHTNSQQQSHELLPQPPRPLTSVHAATMKALTSNRHQNNTHEEGDSSSSSQKAPPGFEFFEATQTAAALADLCRPENAHKLVMPALGFEDAPLMDDPLMAPYKSHYGITGRASFTSSSSKGGKGSNEDDDAHPWAALWPNPASFKPLLSYASHKPGSSHCRHNDYDENYDEDEAYSDEEEEDEDNEGGGDFFNRVQASLRAIPALESQVKRVHMQHGISPRTCWFNYFTHEASIKASVRKQARQLADASFLAGGIAARILQRGNQLLHGPTSGKDALQSPPDHSSLRVSGTLSGGLNHSRSNSRRGSQRNSRNSSTILSRGSKLIDSMSEDGMSSHGGSTRHSIEDPRLRAMYARTAMGRPNGTSAIEAAVAAVATAASNATSSSSAAFHGIASTGGAIGNLSGVRDLLLHDSNSNPGAQAAEAKAALEALAIAARQRPPSLKRWNLDVGGSGNQGQQQPPTSENNKSMWNPKAPSWHPPLPLPLHVLRKAAARALRHGLEVVATGIIGNVQAALAAHAPDEDTVQQDDHEKVSRSSSRARSTRSNRSSTSSVARYQAAKAPLFPVEEASRKLAEGLKGRPMYNAPALMFSTDRQPLHVWVSTTNDQTSSLPRAAHRPNNHHDHDHTKGEMKVFWAIVTLESMERAAAASRRRAATPVSASSKGDSHEVTLPGSGFEADDSVSLSHVVRVERLGRGPAATNAMAQANMARNSLEQAGRAGAGRLPPPLGPYSSSFTTGNQTNTAPTTKAPFEIALYASLKGPSTRGAVHKSNAPTKASELPQAPLMPQSLPDDDTTAVEVKSNHSDGGEVLVLKFECGSEAERDAVADGLELLCFGLRI